MKALARFCLGTATLLLVASCASQSEKTAAKEKDKDEYVFYTPVGSNIPVRVRKSQVTPSEENREESQRWLREVQRSGNKANAN